MAANPANAADFGGTLPSGTATFAAGSSTAHVIVNVSGDTTIEPNENFTVTLSNPSVNATIAAGADTGIGTIVNDDSNTISLGDPNVVGSNNVSHVEGNSGTTGYDFVLTRTGDLSGTASVDFSVAGSGSHPANAADFGGTLPSGTATFAAGSSTAHVIVNVSGDTTIEPNENFTVTLSNPSVNATIAAGADTGLGTIVNDDSNTISLGDPNVVGSNNVSHVEGNSGTTGYDFVLTRTGDLSGTASVDFSVAGSGSHPANASDFAGGTLPSGTATFAAGSSTAHVIVNVSGDTPIEPNENFTVTLSNPSVNATIAAGADTGIGTIVNDDSNTISLGDPNVVGSNNVSHVEGNSGTTGYDFVLTRTGDLSGTASVDFSVAGSGSQSGQCRGLRRHLTERHRDLRRRFQHRARHRQRQRRHADRAERELHRYAQQPERQRHHRRRCRHRYRHHRQRRQQHHLAGRSQCGRQQQRQSRRRQQRHHRL